MGSVLMSSNTLFWSALLIGCVTFMFSIAFMQGVSIMLSDGVILSESYWHSIPWSMATLFASATGGNDWWIIADQLRGAGLMYFLAFYLYIGLFHFVIQNTITSIFVEKLLQN